MSRDVLILVEESTDAVAKKLGVTHWSSRFLATHLGIGDATVARAWREYGLAPWRCETFTFPTTRSWSPRSPTWSACT